MLLAAIGYLGVRYMSQSGDHPEATETGGADTSFSAATNAPSMSPPPQPRPTRTTSSAATTSTTTTEPTSADDPDHEEQESIGRTCSDFGSTTNDRYGDILYCVAVGGSADDYFWSIHDGEQPRPSMPVDAEFTSANIGRYLCEEQMNEMGRSSADCAEPTNEANSNNNETTNSQPGAASWVPHHGGVSSNPMPGPRSSEEQTAAPSAGTTGSN
jgi:hypothetical protein